MSGICGILSLDGQSIEPDKLAPVVSKLEQRGPDGSGIWLGGKVALGHTLLATTPEALIETLPFTHSETGCTITADVRLDNREELFAALEISQKHGLIGDGELILLAYLHWGEACLDHLLGDFAFAIWDPREEKLFCARDQVGMRQFIYHFREDKCLAFATEPEAVVACPNVPVVINEQRLTDFFLENSAVDLTSTFFENVYRLPPAHKLRLSNGTLSVSRYWRLEPRTELHLVDDDAYASAFMEVFTEAVRCRLRGGEWVGAMLSGGMDSGSVVAVAAGILKDEAMGPLQTFSAVGTDPVNCKETRLTYLAAQTANLSPTFVQLAELEEIDDLITTLTIDVAEPFDGPMTLPRAIYLRAHQAGIKAMLDGVSGDIVFDPGNHLADFVRQGRWLQAVTEARAQAGFWGAGFSTWGTLRRAFWHALSPAWLKRARDRLLEGRRYKSALKNSLIDSDLAERGNFKSRLRALRNAVAIEGLSGQTARVGILTHPYFVLGRECYDRIAAANAIEPRDPFADRRLLEFCLSLPVSQLERDGWPKILLRRAMAGRMADNIRWRTGKEHLGWRFNKAYFSTCRHPYPNLDELLRRLEGTVDADRARAMLALLDDDVRLERSFFLRYLGTWLDRFD